MYLLTEAFAGYPVKDDDHDIMINHDLCDKT